MTEKGTRLARVVMICLFLVVFPGIVAAQSNTIVDRLLGSASATMADTAYIVLAAGNIVADDVTANAALATAEKMGWISKNAKPSDPITFGEFSYLLMKTFKVSGGFMYLLFPGPRYAAREVVYRGWVTGDISPYDTVSGFIVLNTLGDVLEEEGKS